MDKDKKVKASDVILTIFVSIIFLVLVFTALEIYKDVGVITVIIVSLIPTILYISFLNYIFNKNIEKSKKSYKLLSIISIIIVSLILIDVLAEIFYDLFIK